MWPDCNPASNTVLNNQHYIVGSFVAQSRSLHPRPWAPEQSSPPDAAHSRSQYWAALHHPPCISLWLPQSSLWACCPGSLWFYSRASQSLSGISCILQTTSPKTLMRVLNLKHYYGNIVGTVIGKLAQGIQWAKWGRKQENFHILSGGKSSQAKSCVRQPSAMSSLTKKQLWPKFKTLLIRKMNSNTPLEHKKKTQWSCSWTFCCIIRSLYSLNASAKRFRNLYLKTLRFVNRTIVLFDCQCCILCTRTGH